MVYKMQNVLSLHLEPLSYLVAEDKVGKKRAVYEKRITTELEKKTQNKVKHLYKSRQLFIAYTCLGSYNLPVKVSVNFTLEQTMKANRVIRGRSILSVTSALDGGEGLKPRSDRFTPGKGTLYLLFRRLVRKHGRSGWVRKLSTHTGIRYPDGPARSEWLYRLRCPGRL
jgi:hypothetical protein